VDEERVGINLLDAGEGRVGVFLAGDRQEARGLGDGEDMIVLMEDVGEPGGWAIGEGP